MDTSAEGKNSRQHVNTVSPVAWWQKNKRRKGDSETSFAGKTIASAWACVSSSLSVGMQVRVSKSQSIISNSSRRKMLSCNYQLLCVSVSHHSHQLVQRSTNSQGFDKTLSAKQQQQQHLETLCSREIWPICEREREWMWVWELNKNCVVVVVQCVAMASFH